MRVLSKRTLRAFWDDHPNAKAPLALWYNRVAAAEWETPADLRKDFGSADFVADNRVIFNLGGHRYRLVAFLSCRFRQVMIKVIGTHADYEILSRKRPLSLDMIRRISDAWTLPADLLLPSYELVVAA